MRDISLRAKLDERRAENITEYQALKELVNLHRPDRYDQLTDASLASYQHFRLAGFSSDSLLDRLTEAQIKRLAGGLQLDASRLFVEKDINYLIRTYGLSFYATRFYRGKAWPAMEENLKQFQQTVLEDDNPRWLEHNYSVLGVSPALNGHPVAASRTPLLFFHLGGDLYFLISTYDSWISSWRRLIYWPFAAYRNGVVAWAIYMTIFLVGLSWMDQQTLKTWLIPIVFPYLSAFIIVSALPLLRSRSVPNNFPHWLNQLIYRVLPY